MFQRYDVPSIESLISEEVDGKRFYVTPTGNKYPSVTTVLGAKKKQMIMEWRKRVGEEKANKISSIASRRGTSFHTLCERYVNNEKTIGSGIMPDVMELFKKIRPIMDENIGGVYYQEQSLWSDRLEMAGKPDLIAEFKSIPSVIDYKTSSKIKTEEQIEDYFCQCTSYAIMVEERTGIVIDQIVILMSVVDSETPLVFIKKTEDYIDKLIEYKKFYESTL